MAPLGLALDPPQQLDWAALLGSVIACQRSQMVSAACCVRAVATVMSAASVCVVAYKWLRRRIQPCPPSQQRQRGAGRPCERPEASLCMAVTSPSPQARLDYPFGLGIGRIRKSLSMIGGFWGLLPI